jgi:hypothetical protein
MIKKRRIAARAIPVAIRRKIRIKNMGPEKRPKYIVNGFQALSPGFCAKVLLVVL